VNAHRFPQPLLEYRLSGLTVLSVGHDSLPGNLERTCCSTQRTRVEPLGEGDARFLLFSPRPVDGLSLLLTQRREESVGTPLSTRERESVQGRSGGRKRQREEKEDAPSSHRRRSACSSIDPTLVYRTCSRRRCGSPVWRVWHEYLSKRRGKGQGKKRENTHLTMPRHPQHLHGRALVALLVHSLDCPFEALPASRRLVDETERVAKRVVG
jgi:hypothetical protein